MIRPSFSIARAATCSALAATLLATAATGLAQIPADQISPQALKKINKLLKLKASFSPEEDKISPNILLASRQTRFLPIGGSDKTIDRTNITADGLAKVQISGKVNAQVLALIRNNGGEILETHKPEGQIMALVPLAALPTIAASSKVKSISEPEAYTTNVGAVTSQAYISHKANVVVEQLGVTGAGVKVGVLSDSASPGTVSNLIASGDLPANTVVLNPGSGADAVVGGTGENEGSAMMEIIHDIAPGAQLYFNTGTSQATFASAITALGAQGCQVIVDDISFYAEGVFQDDTIARAINTFVAGGGIYFSSAANSGNLDSGTSGCYEADFVNGGAVTAAPAPAGDRTGGLFHRFGTNADGTPLLYDTITAATTFITLKWSDPLGASTNDYDLFVTNAAGTSLLASSVARQTGAGNPYESVSSTAGFPAGARIYVVQYNNTTSTPVKTSLTRALHLDTNRGALAIGTRGSVYGHNGGAGTQTVAATFWNSARRGETAFTGAANPVELFSSDGPRRVFYNPDGTQIGTGDPLFATSTAGTTLFKPDFTAADGTTCHTNFTPLPTTAVPSPAFTVPFSPFFGTSAAAPHAAAIAALMISAKPTITNTQIHNILVNTALDNMTNTNTNGKFDPNGGFGVLDAQAAVQAAQALP